MHNPAQERAKDSEALFLRLLLLGVTLAFGSILFPFYGVVLWGSIIALLFAPLYRKLLRKRTRKPAWAALITLLAAVVVAVVPLSLLIVNLAAEAASLYQRLQSGEWNPVGYLHQAFDALPQWSRRALRAVGFANFESLQGRLIALLTQGSQFLATQAFNIGQNTFEFVARIFVTLYLTFFLIRDGEKLVGLVRSAMPMSRLHQEEFFSKFTTVIRATVKGSLLVAIIQGTLGGVAFWYLDVSGPLLWAVLMAVLSLVPVVGSALVWVPVAIYFFLTGSSGQGIALTAWGLLVVGLIDNLLRPILVGRNAHMSDYIVMLATLGGLSIFGFNGLILGPLIAAMFLSVWHIHLGVHPEPSL